MKEITIQLKDSLCGGCSSCNYAVERQGRKIPGVQDITADCGEGTIALKYNGDDSIVQAVKDLAGKFGYEPLE